MIRELDSRISDAIYVRLVWHPDNGRVPITVDDTSTGEAFELAIRERERYPIAYAAQRRGGNGAWSTPMRRRGDAMRRDRQHFDCRSSARLRRCGSSVGPRRASKRVVMLRRIDKVNREG
jgi:hypothetical protein